VNPGPGEKEHAEYQALATARGDVDKKVADFVQVGEVVAKAIKMPVVAEWRSRFKDRPKLFDEFLEATSALFGLDKINVNVR
jgi:hypothetical protein